MSRSNAFVILIVVVLIVAGGIVAYAIFAGDTTPAPSGIVQESTGRSTPLSQASVETAAQHSKELLALLRSLEIIEFDNTLFASPIYQSLTDFTVAVANQPQGRHNPFAPLVAGELFDDGTNLPEDDESSPITDIDPDTTPTSTQRTSGAPPAGL